MHLSGDQLLLSATDVSGFLACPHLTSLAHRKALGGPGPPRFDDPGTEVLRQRGEEHERGVLEAFRAGGLEVRRGPERDWNAGPDGWRAAAERTLEFMRSGVDVIHQGVLNEGNWLGLPDFLQRVERPSRLGAWSYEVIDAKLARSAKATAVLQICFYSELLEAAQGRRPEAMHLALGGRADGEPPFERFRVADFAAYYRSVRGRFLEALARGGRNGPPGADTPDADLPTYPEPCEHCRVCDWSPRCRERWRRDDHLSLVAGISRHQRSALEARGVSTLEGLADLPLPLEPPLDSVGPAAFARVREQARVQREGRRRGAPYHELLADDLEEGTGLLTLPAPSPGDLFVDLEGDPHALPDGLEYLFGQVDVDGDYTALRALTPAEERARFETFMDGVTERLERWPDLHVYHFNHYEPTAFKRLASRYATREEELDRLLRGGVFVDLYRVVRQGLRASVESYSIKKLEPFYGFEREEDLRSASSALASFEAWLQLGRPGEDDPEGDPQDALLQAIERYNRDDCQSTRALRDWLEERRAELETHVGRALPRPEPGDPDPSDTAQERGERVQALMDALLEDVPDDPAERGPSTEARWVLAHLLTWHRREKKSMWWEYFRLMELDADELLQDGKALAGLEYEGVVAKVKRSLVHRYRFPPQDYRLRTGDRPHDPATGGCPGEIVALDEDAGTVDLKRGKNSKKPHPAALIPFDNVPDRPLPESLEALAEDVVGHGLTGARNQAAAGVLTRRLPRVGQEPGASLRRPGETALEAARRIALGLEGTALPVQGPPGSGKTYIGARMITTLLATGRRVGVTATSHKVIVNLLDEICRAADEEGVRFRGLQKADEDRGCEHPAIEATGDPKAVAAAAAAGEVDLVAGTAWLWARDDIVGAVDVLFVDEAGQMSLANALAASRAADSLVLLGDPRQLEQPHQGVHPPGTGVSVLEHLVGEGTLDAGRGLFLEETWRLHPDLCAFTSELFYEGRLSSRPPLVRQRLVAPSPLGGAGLRFVPVEHTGNASESPEEVEKVRRLVEGLLGAGASWVDERGAEARLTLEDILIVAPYNAQVSALRSALPPRARVGTVDRFQGQQAPLVVYSTATSSAADAPRGMEFVYNPNRLNVATSRARCVAVVVGSPALHAPDCRSVRQMRLANGFCRLGEMAGYLQ